MGIYWKKFAEIMVALGAKVIYYNRSTRSSQFAKQVSLEELFSKAILSHSIFQ